MFKKAFISSIAATFIVSSASAAELGSFLVKLQGEYSISESSLNSSIGTPVIGVDLGSKIKNKDFNGFGVGVGFGYVASEDIWTDVTVTFDSLKSKQDLGNKAFTKVESNNTKALLNAYYGFNQGNIFSPYVTIGFGAAFAKSKLFSPSAGVVINGNAIKDTTDNPLKGQQSSKNTAYFAYQGGFGVAIEAMKSVSFDIGYRLSNNQVAKFNIPTLSNTLVLKPTNQIKHSVLLGVNIAF